MNLYMDKEETKRYGGGDEYPQSGEGSKEGAGGEQLEGAESLPR